MALADPVGHRAQQRAALRPRRPAPRPGGHARGVDGAGDDLAAAPRRRGWRPRRRCTGRRGRTTSPAPTWPPDDARAPAARRRPAARADASRASNSVSVSAPSSPLVYVRRVLTSRRYPSGLAGGPTLGGRADRFAVCRLRHPCARHRLAPAVGVRTDFPRAVRRIDHTWIPLADGTRLAARIWLPEDAERDPVPAILEYLPYRKGDAFARARLLPPPLLRRPRLRGRARRPARHAATPTGSSRTSTCPRSRTTRSRCIAWLAAAAVVHAARSA